MGTPHRDSPLPRWPVGRLHFGHVGEGAVDHAVLQGDNGMSATGLSGNTSASIEMHCAQVMPDQQDLLKELYLFGLIY